MYKLPPAKPKTLRAFEPARLDHSRQLWAAEPLVLTEIEEIHSEAARPHRHPALRIACCPRRGD